MCHIPDKPIGIPEGYPQALPSSEVRRRFLKLLGEFAAPEVPLNMTVTAEEKLPGGVLKQRIEYDVSATDRVPAFHLFLDGLPAAAPGVVSIHAHGGETIFPLGKAFHCHPDPQAPEQYSYRAALAGFRVIAPDALTFGERQTKWGHSRFFADEINHHMELCSRGSSLAWKSVWDNSRAIEVLEALGAPVIGAMGWSGGSTQGYILAAANEKVKATACFFSFMTLRHQFYQHRCCHCLYHFIPGMMRAGIDWDQVAALAAPRKLFFGWAARDAGSPEPMYRAFVDAIEKRCRGEGLPPSVFVHEEPEGGHELTAAMMNAALDFLHRHLRTGADRRAGGGR